MTINELLTAAIEQEVAAKDAFEATENGSPEQVRALETLCHAKGVIDGITRCMRSS